MFFVFFEIDAWGQFQNHSFGISEQKKAACKMLVNFDCRISIEKVRTFVRNATWRAKGSFDAHSLS